MFSHRIPRRHFLIGTAQLAGLATVTRAFGSARDSGPDLEWLGPLDREGRLGPLIHAPSDARHWPAWRDQLMKWRDRTRRELSYDDGLYERSDLRWAARCFSCGFVMMCDLKFHDPDTGRFTVDSFLDEGVRDFGGYDAIVLWHAYPRIGFDDRNQFDFYRDMPGGLPGLLALSRLCRARGVRVFVNYNPWDTGTRRDHRSDIDALAELVGAIEADGIFLDTLHRGADEFRARLDATRPGVVLESELELPVEGIAAHHLSWAQWFKDGEVPGVLRNQWFERRHRMHQIKRWHRDHTEELHTAWMNGGGMLVWENVFGSWLGWNARDRASLRAMLPIQRRYASLFAGEGWTPLVPTLAEDVHASSWEGNGVRLWTLVNRSNRPVEGILLEGTAPPWTRFFDLVRGTAVTTRSSNGIHSIPGQIGPRGIGCVLAMPPGVADPELDSFLAEQRQVALRLTDDTRFPVRTVTLRPGPVTEPFTAVPPGMVEIPAARVIMTVEFRSRECGFYEVTPSPDLIWGWAPLHEPRFFTRDVQLARYAMDLTPVTNAQFARFLEASGYQPRYPEHFLAHWSQGAPPAGLEDHPVVYVSLDDARAYARWTRKRLPTEDEWQYAAAGPQALLYPWGNKPADKVCNDGTRGGTTPVRAFPDGRSPFGAYDCCGNVWHWTESERSDGRTRFCVLKGGSWYQARGSDWYADGGLKPCRFAAKFLLMWPGLDRSATIGFRCVADLD